MIAAVAGSLFAILGNDLGKYIFLFFNRKDKPSPPRRSASAWALLIISFIVSIVFGSIAAFAPAKNSTLPPKYPTSILPSTSEETRVIFWIICGVSAALFAILGNELSIDIVRFFSKKGRPPKKRPLYIWILFFVSFASSFLFGFLAASSPSFAQEFSPTTEPKITPVVVTVIVTTTPFSTHTPQTTDTPLANVSNLPTSTPDTNWLIEIYQEKRGDSLFWIISLTIGIMFTYLIGIGALVFMAWEQGSNIFSRSWLTLLASKPLLISPGVGRWSLFLGYKKRLENQSDVLRASTRYFGVPGIDVNGKHILPDTNGNNFNETIAKSLDSQKPIVIEAKGGGGKTTILARWAYLALENRLPPPLGNFRPIFVSPAYYNGNLIDSIASVLRERDGVAVNGNMIRAQLESGKYLILFDAVSEIETDQNKGLQEILRTAGNADYRNCRFLITTRPGLNIPSGTSVFQLQPLTANTVLQLLPSYQLDKEQEHRVRRQLTLFGEKPLEPLLFTMIIEQGKSTKLSSTRAQLYERYFRKLLQVTSDTVWDGWRVVLGEFAKWFTLDTGRRGFGIIHENLVDRISGNVGDQTGNNLFERGKKYYGLPVESELSLLDRLRSAGVMQQSKRWRFAHDTFEEYFAANFIVSYLTRYEKMPSLGLWTINDVQIQSFVGVIEFVNEMADEEVIKIILNSNLPSLWKDVLDLETKGYN